MRFWVLFALLVIHFDLILSLKYVTGPQLEQLIQKNQFLVVLFQSDMSEEQKETSKKISDEFEQLVEYVKDTRFKLVATTVDQYPAIFSELSHSDVPAIVIFREKYPRIYFGQKSAVTLYTFLVELINSEPVKLITSKLDKKFFADENTVKVIGYFPKEDQNYDVFKSAAKHFQQDLQFGVIQDPKIANSFKFKFEGEILIQKPSEKNILSETTFSTREALVDWISQNKKPLWGILNVFNMFSIWGTDTTFAAFLNNFDSESSKKAFSLFKNLAKQNENKMSFVAVSAAKFKEFVAGVGLTEGDLPNFVIFIPSIERNFIFPKDKQELNVKNAKKWIHHVLSGKLEDQPERLYSESDNIVQLDDTNFEEVVNDETKDVLVEFYVPWCSRCQAFAHYYKSLAYTLGLFPTLTIAAFDGTRIEPPQRLEFTTYPALFFFPAKNKANPIFFEGPEDLVGLSKFLLKHQTTMDEEAITSFKQFVQAQISAKGKPQEEHFQSEL